MTPQQQARLILSAKIVELCDDYLNEFAGDAFWEEFDPEVDEIRTKAQELVK